MNQSPVEIDVAVDQRLRQAGRWCRGCETRSFSSKPPSPLAAELMLTPGRRCSGVGDVLVRQLADVVRRHHLDDRIRIALGLERFFQREPDAGDGDRHSRDNWGRRRVGGVAWASFRSDGCDVAGDTSLACCDDGTGACAAACCARTGITVLIRASATADAIGVFLSFMTFPLVLALAMPKTAGPDVSSGGPVSAPRGHRVLQYDRTPTPEPMRCHYTTTACHYATNCQKYLLTCCKCAKDSGCRSWRPPIDRTTVRHWPGAP